MIKGKCKKCADHQAFYHSGFFMFWIEKQGLCCNAQKVVKEKEVCEFYRPPSEEDTTMIQSLDIAIDDIKVLQKIYGE